MGLEQIGLQQTNKKRFQEMERDLYMPGLKDYDSADFARITTPLITLSYSDAIRWFLGTYGWYDFSVYNKNLPGDVKWESFPHKIITKMSEAEISEIEEKAELALLPVGSLRLRFRVSRGGHHENSGLNLRKIEGAIVSHTMYCSRNMANRFTWDGDRNLTQDRIFGLWIPAQEAE